MTNLQLLQIVYDKLIIFSLIFARIATFFSVFTLFRHEKITLRIMIGLSFILTLVVLTVQPINYHYSTGSALKLLFDYLFQIGIGFAAGIFVNLILEIFLAAGQIISTQIGLGFISLIDPRFGMLTSLSQFYVIAATVIFFSLEGHLVLIQTLINSFSTLPINHAYLPAQLLLHITSYAAVIFTGGVRLAFIIIIAIFLTNLALAVLTKFAPQINIFAIGVNLTIVIGILCIFLTFNVLQYAGSEIILEGLMNFKDLFKIV